jgi:hypothetical protein
MPVFEVNLHGQKVDVEMPEAATDEQILRAALMKAGTFREKFKAGAQTVAEPISKGVAAFSRASFPEQAPNAPEALGEAVSSFLIPETPEGVALGALPFFRGMRLPGKLPNIPSPTGSAVKNLTIPPTVGAGTAALTGGSLPEVAGGAVTGAVSGATGAAGQLGQRAVRTRTTASIAEEQTRMADSLWKAMKQESPAFRGIVGHNPADRMIRATNPARKTLSDRFQAMEDEISSALGDTVLDLPLLGRLRGKTKTIPMTQQGRVVTDSAGKPLTQEVLDTSFTAREAMKMLKDVALHARQASKRGEPAAGYRPREVDRMADEEFRNALSQAGQDDLATSFLKESSTYRRGTRLVNFLKEAKAAGVFKAGGPKEGGVEPTKLRDFLVAKGDKLGISPDEFPNIFAAAFEGQSLGARSLEQAILSTPFFVETRQGTFFRPSLGKSQVPLGKELGASRPVKVLQGLGALGGEEAAKPFNPPRVR